MQCFAIQILLVSLLSGCCAPADIKPSLSKNGCWQFPAAKVTKVIVRAADADTAVVADGEASAVEVSAVPAGGALGYHSPDPAWEETPANEWGLGFAGRQYGSTLILSSRNEISYIHHHYSLTNIHITKPAHVRVILQKRTLDGNGAPDLGGRLRSGN